MEEPLQMSAGENKNPFQKEPSGQLLKDLIEQLIRDKNYEGVILLFSKDSDGEKTLACMPAIALDLYRDICLVYLTDEIFKKENSLYCCVEELFKEVSKYAPSKEFLLELIEVIEEVKSEHVFTTFLKGVAEVLKRFEDSKPRAFEWTFNSIFLNLEALPKPPYLAGDYDEKQEQLLEQEPTIQNLFMRYVVIGLFLDNLLETVLQEPQTTMEGFFDTTTRRRTVTICFLIQLLKETLAYLDLTNDGRKTNSYTLQCAKKFTDLITQLVGEPFLLLESVAQRKSMNIMSNSDSFLYDLSCKNIFLIEEKLPTLGVGIYLHMLLSEKDPTKSPLPTIYEPLCLLETSLYTIIEMLDVNVAALNYKGLISFDNLLNKLGENFQIPGEAVKSAIYRDFSLSLINVTGFSPQERIRGLGVKTIKRFIYQFTDSGKYEIIQSLMYRSKHNGIVGFLSGIYKDLVNAALRKGGDLPLPFKGHLFKDILLNKICHLSNGTTTDLINESDSIIAGLNIIRFFSLKDNKNATGFWSFHEELEKNYLDPLKKGINLSLAHYKAELQKLENTSSKDYEKSLENHVSLNLSIPNGEEKASEKPENDKNWKINKLNVDICNLELMQCLLSSASECLDRKKNLSVTTKL